VALDRIFQEMESHHLYWVYSRLQWCKVVNFHKIVSPLLLIKLQHVVGYVGDHQLYVQWSVVRSSRWSLCPTAISR